MLRSFGGDGKKQRSSKVRSVAWCRTRLESDGTMIGTKCLWVNLRTLSRVEGLEGSKINILVKCLNDNSIEHI